MALLALLVNAVRTAAAPLTNSDTYFHLRLGEEFLSGWRPWAPGHPSESSSAHWVPTQWLSEVGLALVERAGGLPALALLYGVLLVVAVLVWYWSARRGADPLAAVLVTALAVVATGPALSLRPQPLSIVLATVTVAWWNRARSTGRVPWGLMALGWVWAMTHGMWVLGVGASVVLCAGAVAEGRLGRRALLVPAGMLAAAAITPAGPRLLLAVVEVNARAEYFGEWGPPRLTEPDGLAALALLAACVLPMLGRRPGATYELAVVLVGMTFIVYSARTVPMAAAVLVPLAAERLQDQIGARSRVGRTERWLLMAGTAAGVICVALLAPARADVAPAAVTAFDERLDALPTGATVLTDSDVGGFLLWARPDLEVPVHGYGDVYTDSELERLDDLFRLAPDWGDQVRKLHPDAALLPEDAPLRAALEERGWTESARAEGRVYLIAPQTWTDRPRATG
ncbi:MULTISPECIES: hypothetical protein [Nocardioides]|uniref:Glycosyltransferase RgtA/B/C/D-like domain-containing protein n=1 Tax=Nocardioides vastitatis TaxID=2568655 RepID=A0ABW0ZBL1_9ACTN|nr:hypothetical protein [Nocardioides sp.]THJ12584.1 hypothetical protein E7Z54_02005 [Nocardioides sp.]